jgi:hypothetical protein
MAFFTSLVLIGLPPTTDPGEVGTTSSPVTSPGRSA